MARKTRLPRHNAVRQDNPAARHFAPTVVMLGLWGVGAAWAGEPTPPPPAKATAPSTAAASTTIPSDPATDVSTRVPIFPDAEPNNGVAPNSGSWLGKWAESLTFGGVLATRYQTQSVSGGPGGTESYLNEYGSDSYDARRVGPLQQTMDLTVQGKVFNVFSLNARLSNARYGSYVNQTFGFNYKAKGTSVDIGDVAAQLGGNGLVTLSKNLQGVMIGRDFGKIRMTGIASLTKGTTRKGAFRGLDTSGPYFLGGASLIEGSERLRLDGVDLVRDRDYVIDYLQGQVSFLGGRIVPSASTVEYSFESHNYNSTPGLLGGTRWDFDLGGGNTFGFTRIEQKSSHRGSGDRELHERFPIARDPNYRYTLTALIEPDTPVEVRWLEQLLTENADYELNREQHYLRLKRVLPPDTSLTATASLGVRYRPRRGASVSGDRSVTGIDTNLKLGQNATIGVQFGRSQSPDAQTTGQGMTLTASLRSPGTGNRNQWALSTSWRDIGAGFSTIDSTSGAFLRAEKGLNANLSFSPNAFVNFTTAFTRSRVAQQDYSASLIDVGGAQNQNRFLGWATNATWSANLALNFPNLPTLGLGHTQVTQTGSSRSTFTSDLLNVSWQRGIFGLTGALGRTQSRGQSVFLGGNSSGSLVGSAYGSDLANGGGYGGVSAYSANDSASTTSRLSLNVTPAAWIGLTGNIGFSRTQYGSASTVSVSSSDARARDLSYGITLTPLANLTAQANFADTTNGQSTAAFTGGSGQTNTGAGSLFPNSVSGQQTRSRQLSVQYTPFRSLTLNWDASRQLALIPGYDNTQSTTQQMGFALSAHAKLQLTGSLVDQNVTYVGDQNDSSNRSYLLGATAGPFGRVSISSSLQQMKTGFAAYNNSGQTGGIPGINDGVGGVIGGGTNPNNFFTGGQSQQQNLTILSTRMDYPLGGGRTLFLQWQSLDTRSPGQTLGGADDGDYRVAANTRRSVGTVGMDFRINQILGFTVDMNLIRMDDQDNSRYSYRARTMNADLSARF